MQINNSTTIQELIKGAGLSSALGVPNQIDNKVIPVLEVNPRLLRRITIVKRNEASNSTSATLYVTPTNQDFYIVACHLSVIKDVTATSAISKINVLIDGAAINLAEIRSFSLTVQDRGIFLYFHFPIKIDRGNTITVTNSTNVANVAASGTIYGYLDESNVT